MEDITSFKTLVGTLYKKFNKASVYGKLDIKYLYILDIINEFIYECPTCFNESNIQKLKQLEVKFKYLDKDICIYNIDKPYYYNNTLDNYNNSDLKLINTPPTIENPPELDGSIILEEPGDIYQFNSNIFKYNFYDAQGDLPLNVKITTLPIYGILTFDGELIESNFTFNISQSNKLRYERISSLEYSDNIIFQTSDNNINQLYSNMATFTINVNQYINLPPDSIGNNSLSTANRQTVVFTQADFTSNTTPPYEDPEGDGPYKLKVKTLPSQGLLKLNGVNVILNQEILFTDINNGLLTFVPSDTNAAFSVNFNFDISDLGSQQFSGL